MTREDAIKILEAMQEMTDGISDISEASRIAIEALEKSEKSAWIPIEKRPLTEEEKEEFGDEYCFMFDCPLPDNGQEILISQFGKWVSTTVFSDDYGVGDEDGHDWSHEVDAWMPLPEPYKEGELK